MLLERGGRLSELGVCREDRDRGRRDAHRRRGLHGGVRHQALTELLDLNTARGRQLTL